MVNTNFDGRTDCPKCAGRGVYDLDISKLEPFAIPGVVICDCVHERDLRDHLNNILPSLPDIKPVEILSPLEGKDSSDLWVTTRNEFLPHFAKIMRSRGTRKTCKVISDLEILRAWLYNASEIYDGDINASKNVEMDSYARIEDLVLPPDLLVIKLGVKTARNSAMPECFLEALRVRQLKHKPTWVLDSPEQPLGSGHLCWDSAVEVFLMNWKRLNLTLPQKTPPGAFASPVQAPSPSRGGESLPLARNKPTGLPLAPFIVGEVEGYVSYDDEEDSDDSKEDPFNKLAGQLFAKKKRKKR